MIEFYKFASESPFLTFFLFFMAIHGVVEIFVAFAGIFK